MALYGRDLLLPLTRHLDGTSGRRWSKSGPPHGQAQTALFPTSADNRSLTSKPEGAARTRRRVDVDVGSVLPEVFVKDPAQPLVLPVRVYLLLVRKVDVVPVV